MQRIRVTHSVDWRLCLLVGLVLLAMQGCGHVVTVRTPDGRIGRAVRVWATVSHVPDGKPVRVRDVWWQGDVLCDPVRTSLGMPGDPITLLVPRCEDYGRTGPGDSGSPVVGSDGRVLGLHVGTRYSVIRGR